MTHHAWLDPNELRRDIEQEQQAMKKAKPTPDTPSNALTTALADILPLAEDYLSHAPSHPDNAKLESARMALVTAKEMTGAEIMQAVDLRVNQKDLEHTKQTIADLDAKIAKLQQQRDRQLRYQGMLEERLQKVTKLKKNDSHHTTTQR